MPIKHPTYGYKTTWGASVPGTYSGNTAPITIAQRYQFNQPRWIIGARMYMDKQDAGHHFAWITIANVMRGVLRFKPNPGPFTVEAGLGWYNAYFRPRIIVATNDVAKLFVWGPAFQYWRSAGALTAGSITVGDVTLPQDGPTANGAKTTSANLNANAGDAGARYGIDLIYWYTGL